MVYNVGQIHKLIDTTNVRPAVSPKQGTGESFKDVLRKQIEPPAEESSLHFSVHAQKRLAERGITLTPDNLSSIQSALTKLKEKGARESLLLLNNLGLLVNVKNDTVITVLNNDELMDKVFTNIDSTMIIS